MSANKHLVQGGAGEGERSEMNEGSCGNITLFREERWMGIGKKQILFRRLSVFQTMHRNLRREPRSMLNTNMWQVKIFLIRYVSRVGPVAHISPYIGPIYSKA